MSDLSKLCQSVMAEHIKRTGLLKKLIRNEPYIAAQVYERYKTCGNKNCKCHKGEPHGPFLWIYQHKKNLKIVSTTVEKSMARQAKDMATSYRKWIETRQAIRETEQNIQGYLNEMEALLEQEISVYVTKRTSGRPKKIRGDKS